MSRHNHICFFFLVYFLAAGAWYHEEPPLLPTCPPSSHGVCVQPDHSGLGGGHACQPDPFHHHPASTRHENLPQPPAGRETSSTSQHLWLTKKKKKGTKHLLLCKCLSRCRRTVSWLSAVTTSFKTFHLTGQGSVRNKYANGKVKSSHIRALIQVCCSHAGDQLAEQPPGSHLTEDGGGCHLHSGGKGGDFKKTAASPSQPQKEKKCT